MVAEIRIHQMPEFGSWTVEARMLGKGDRYLYEILLQRTEVEYEIDLAITIIPLSAISQLADTLDGFDEERRRYRHLLRSFGCLRSISRLLAMRPYGLPETIEDSRFPHGISNTRTSSWFGINIHTF